MTPWITVIGIGADGMASLTKEAQKALKNATLLVGGCRHQNMISDDDVGAGVKRLVWSNNIVETLDIIETRRGEFVTVIASGDPMSYGIGSTIAQRFEPDEIKVIPSLGAFSQVCARMVWPQSDVAMITVHGRSSAVLNLHMQPRQRIAVLSWNRDTPNIIADLLTAKGFGDSHMTVFSDMGAEGEKRYEGIASSWPSVAIPDLNTICIECVAGAEAIYWPRTPGLPESAYLHDGQITKCEMRAVTIAKLEPQVGETLWDVGAGCGSIAIEWLRCTDGTFAYAIERDDDRSDFIRQNADNLGVPRLAVVMGSAPSVLANLPNPEKIFVGGGVSSDKVLEVCWKHLKVNGLLVCNAVTLEAQQRLMSFGVKIDGSFIRLSTARSGGVGSLTVLRPMMDVLQLSARKL